MTAKLNRYRVEFEDGTVTRVHGRYAAHGWAVACQLHPGKQIKAFALVENPAEKAAAP